MNKKRTIVLASLLKPVDEPRMFEKFALSMAQTNKYAINIIGFSTKKIPQHPDITFYPIFNFKRLSLDRILAPLKYWRILVNVKPELIIVNTHELLLVSCAYQILFGGRLVYDVQENYLQNIIWSSSLPLPLRYVVGYGIRAKEHLAKRMIVHFLLAEKCYLNECSFITSSFTFLENKARFPLVDKFSSTSDKRKRNDWNDIHRPVQLLYSGTIAESYGIFDCLQLLEAWNNAGIYARLTIIGYCPREDTLQELHSRLAGKPYLRLLGGNEPVPHTEILKELLKTDFSLISYRINPSNKDCFPTRIWECLAYKIPMIMKPEHPWIPLLNTYRAGMVIDFLNPSAPPPYVPENYFKDTLIPSSFYWEHEEKKLLNSLDFLF